MKRNVSRRNIVKSTGLVSAATIGLAGCLGGDGGDGGSNGGNEWPTQSIRMVIPFGAGGGTDSHVRAMAPVLSEHLGESIQPENIPEAGSLRGTAEVLRAEPDGYTLLAMNPPSTPINEMVNPQDWDMTELVGLGRYARSVRVLIVSADSDYEDLSDVIEAYQNDEISSFGSQPKGSIDHVIAEVLKSENGMEWENYVGYEGSGPVAEAVSSGEVPVGVGTDAAMLSAVEGGTARPIAAMHSTGSSVFPDAPTLDDLGLTNIDYVGAVTRCFYGPPGTPDNIIQTFTAALEESIQTSGELEEWQEETGNTLEYGGPEEANEVLQQSYEEIPDKVDIESLREES